MRFEYGWFLMCAVRTRHYERCWLIWSLHRSESLKHKGLEVGGEEFLGDDSNHGLHSS